MIILFLIIAAILLTRTLAAIAPHLGLVDLPGERKHHSGAIPLVGGIGIFATLLVAVLFLGVSPYTGHLLLVACLVFVVGLLDDLMHIRAGARLLISYLSGILLAVYGGIAIHNVGDLLAIGDIPLLLLTVPLTALAVAGLSNAYNMIDGIDGLAAGTIALPLLVLFALALEAGHPMSSFLVSILIPLGVFLQFNLGPGNRMLPRIFLGDAGSVTLGLLVTASLIYFSQGENALILPVTALWLVTLPLMDMLATMLRRLRQGRKLMLADRSHLHHTLMDSGLGARLTLLVLLAYGAICAGIGLLLEHIPEYISLLCYCLLFAVHCLFVAKVGSRPVRVHAGV